MTSWSPFRFFVSHDATPQYSAAIKDMMSRYILGKDYGQEDQYSHPYMSEPLLAEIESLPHKILPSLRAKGALECRNINEQMDQYMHLSGSGGSRAQRIQKAIDGLMHLSNVECQIIAILRAREADADAADEAWVNIRAAVSSEEFRWHHPQKGMEDLRSPQAYLRQQKYSLIDQTTAKVQIIEERLGGIKAQLSTVAKGFRHVGVLSEKMENTLKQSEENNALLDRVAFAEQRILAVAAVAAHGALTKDRVAALEAENQALKERLATLEMIILGKSSV